MGNDTPFSHPPERALDATVRAAKRARGAAEEADVHSPRSPHSLPPSRPSVKALLQASAVVVAALVLGFGGALAALELRGVPDVPSPALGSGQPRRHAVAAPRSPRPSRAAQAIDSAASSTSPPRSAIPSSASGLVTAPRSPVQAEAQGALAGSEPHLVAVSPPVARAGQLLTISGTNFYSPDGLVQAFVGGTGAPTRCPTETVCVVTVPQGLGPSRDLPLAIETEAGTSNTLSVSYAE